MKKKQVAIIAIFFILVVALTMGGVYYYMTHVGIRRQDVKRLQTEDYQAVFASMYDISNVVEADFVTYRGLCAVKMESDLRGFKDWAKLNELLFPGEKTVDIVYMGLDPVELWRDSRRDEAKWIEDMQAVLCNTIAQQQDVTFEITLAAPHMEYWLDMSEEEVKECLTLYQRTVDMLAGYKNVVMFFYGAQEWLIINPENYSESVFGINEGVAHFFLLSTVCDKKYVVNSVSMQEELKVLDGYIKAEMEEPTQYADLSEWEIVFFGDSIIALEQTTSSIPDMVEVFSKASAYDCAEGGTLASVDYGEGYNFVSFVEAFLNNRTEGYVPEDNFFKGIQAFTQRTTKKDKICFVINFGLNDYFNGVQVDDAEDLYNTHTYAGALRSGIAMLQEAYPKAMIVLTTPSYVDYFDAGTQVNSEVGGVQADYVNAVKTVASQMGILYKDNYVELGINATNSKEYLLDGCHLNGAGRLEYAQQLVAWLAQNIQK